MLTTREFQRELGIAHECIAALDAELEELRTLNVQLGEDLQALAAGEPPSLSRASHNSQHEIVLNKQLQEAKEEIQAWHNNVEKAKRHGQQMEELLTKQSQDLKLERNLINYS